MQVVLEKRLLNGCLSESYQLIKYNLKTVDCLFKR